MSPGHLAPAFRPGPAVEMAHPDAPAFADGDGERLEDFRLHAIGRFRDFMVKAAEQLFPERAFEAIGQFAAHLDGLGGQQAVRRSAEISQREQQDDPVGKAQVLQGREAVLGDAEAAALAVFKAKSQGGEGILVLVELGAGNAEGLQDSLKALRGNAPDFPHDVQESQGPSPFRGHVCEAPARCARPLLLCGISRLHGDIYTRRKERQASGKSRSSPHTGGLEETFTGRAGTVSVLRRGGTSGCPRARGAIRVIPDDSNWREVLDLRPLTLTQRNCVAIGAIDGRHSIWQAAGKQDYGDGYGDQTIPSPLAGLAKAQ